VRLESLPDDFVVRPVRGPGGRQRVLVVADGRELLLQERVASGHLDQAGARRLARRIFSENARAFFALPRPE